jgi:hypothetical protein
MAPAARRRSRQARPTLTEPERARGNGNALSTFDKTFSCRVRRQHFVNLTGSANLPSTNGQRQPGGLYLTTVQKTREQNGALVTLTQVSLSARKNSLRIDLSTCNRVKRQIPLKPKGLPGPPVTLTPHHQGFDNERCGATGPGTRPTSVQDDERSSVARVVCGPQRQREEAADRVLQLEPGQGQRVYGEQLRRQLAPQALQLKLDLPPRVAGRDVAPLVA